MQVREKLEKSRFTVFFPMICGSGGSKSRLATAAGAEPSGQIRDEQSFWREARLPVKKLKTHNVRSTFGGCAVEKVHAVVARSTFGSQNVQNTSRTTFGSWDVEKVHVVVARSTFRSQQWKKQRVWSTLGRSDVVLRGRHKGFCTLPKVSKTWGFCSIVNYNHYTALHYTTTTNTTTLHYTTIHWLHYTTLHFTTLHYTRTTLNYTTTTPTTTTATTTALHCTTLHYTILITIHYTTLLFTTLHYTTLKYATLLSSA